MRTFVFLCLAGVGISILAGCGFWPLPTNDQGTDNNDTVKPVVYQAGEFAGVLADDIGQFVTLVPFDGTQTDKPVVIAGSALMSLSTDERNAIRAIHEAGHPVALVHADLNQILFLQRTVLENAVFEYSFPDGEVYAEIYAVDGESDGDAWQWSQFPPPVVATGYTEESRVNLQTGQTESTTTTNPTDVSLDDDNDMWQDSRVEIFAQWLSEDGSRSETPLAVNAKNRALKEADASSLTQLAAAFVDQGNFVQEGNNYQVSHFVYKCHSISSDPSKAYDWFYVQQYGVFSGKGAYTINQSMNRGWYLDQIEMDTSMSGFVNNTAAVGLIQSSPSTANKETQITSGISYNIGGEVGLDTNGPSGKLSAGVTISNSTMVSVRDCEIKDLCNDKGNNAHWQYEFKRAAIGGVSDCFFQNCLVGPPELAITTFKPMNQWIWKLSPEVRARNAPMSIQCRVQLCRSEESWKFLWANLTHYFKATYWARTIYVPYPPTAAQ